MLPTRHAPLDTALRVLRRAWSRLREQEQGQSLVEYSLIVVLVTLCIIVLAQVVGHQSQNLFSNIGNGLSGH